MSRVCTCCTQEYDGEDRPVEDAARTTHCASSLALYHPVIREEQILSDEYWVEMYNGGIGLHVYAYFEPFVS